MMKSENLSNVAEILRKAKQRVYGDGLSLSLDAEDVKFFSRELYPLLEFGGKDGQVSRLPGALNRYDAHEIHVGFIGPTNSGKTGLLRLSMSEAVADRVGPITLPDGSVIEDILGAQDIPDKTKAILKVPLSDSFVIWDTPGLYGDKPALSKFTATLFGLENEVSELPVIDTSSDPASYEKMPINTLLNHFPRKRIIVIFIVDLTMTPFSYLAQEQLKADIQRLYELYGERLLVVGSFKDKLDVWDRETREERIEIWKQILGDIPMIQYSGKTSAGLLEIMRGVLHRSGGQASDLLPYFNAEAKGSRLTHSLHNLAGLVAAVLTSTSINVLSAPRDMHTSLLCLAAFYASVHYSVSETEWLNLNGDLARIADSVVSEEESVWRQPKGFFETLASWFGKDYYAVTEKRYLSVEALAETCVFLYRIVHGFEKIQSPIVEETVAESWFSKRFTADHIDIALETGDTYSLHLNIGEALIDFWREFHPLSLDLSTRIGG